MDNFIYIVLYLLIGIAARRIPRFSPETPMVLNTFVLYIALPALVLQKVPMLHVSTELLIPALTPWLLLLLVVGAILALGRVFGWERNTIIAMLIVLPLGNTSFLGFPMIEAFFGEAWMPYAMIYDQVGSFVALATYSTLLAAMFGEQQTKVTWQSMALKILTFPPFLALLLGLALKSWSYPPLFVGLLDNLAQTLVPVIMIAVGFQMQFKLTGERLSPLLSGLGIKLIAMPAVAWLGCWSLGLSGKAVDVSVFEAAMPPMVSAGAIAMMAGLAPRLVTGLVGYGLIASFITLPIWYWLLQHA